MVCPSDDVLGAYLEQSLGADETRGIAAHLDGCGACRRVVIAAVRGAAPPTVLALGTPSLPERPRSAYLAPGTRIGRYEVRALLGAGGMGQVYEAYDAELDRSIALKILRVELAGSAAALAERLLRESRLMAKVVDPAVIAVYDVGRTDDRVFIAMELVRGETLAAHVARRKPSWREVVELFVRAAGGLAAAHAAGVVHRDFKPDNVLVELDGDRAKRVIVTDFGIARAIDAADDEHTGEGARGDVRLTATGITVGTPAYMAPEQTSGTAVDTRADVFAFSVALWEALYGTRPFAGKTVDEIREAMREPPQPPRTGVPRHVVRAVLRGLARDPAERWPDMPSLANALGARSRRRTVALAGAGAALVAAGILGAVMLARPDDACAPALAKLRAAYDRDAVGSALARDRRVHDLVLAKLDSMRTGWTMVHLATCRADRDPPQSPTVAACLEARRAEIESFSADVIADGPGHALALGGVLGEVARCAAPPPGALFAHVPEDPAQRRAVAAVRYRAFDAEAARDRGDFKTAIAAETTLVAETEHAWPPLHAELLYLLGNTQTQGGDSKAGMQSLRAAAALAESVHHDYIAASSWIQLALSATFDEGEPQRGLEYITYAEAAVDRLGRPDLVVALFEYVKGTTLIEADRTKEAEVSLRHAVELGETTTPEYLAPAIQGLGYLYEHEGRYGDAVAAYRRALARLHEHGVGSASEAVNFRARLADNLRRLGKDDEAVAVSREAVAIADRMLGGDNQDRYTAHGDLAQVLDDAGKRDEALAEARLAAEGLRRISGERNERYAEALSGEAMVLNDLGRYDEAAALYARACETIAFSTGDGSTQQAACWINQANSWRGQGKTRDALALLDKTLPVITKGFGDVHPEIGNVLLARAQLHAELQQRDEALADLDRARSVLEHWPEVDPGYLASVHWLHARVVWRTDHERAASELHDSLASYDRASAHWREERARAAEWLATDGKPHSHAR